MQVIIVIAIPAKREKSENKENKILTKLEISLPVQYQYCRKIKSLPQNHKIKICTTHRNILNVAILCHNACRTRLGVNSVTLLGSSLGVQ